MKGAEMKVHREGCTRFYLSPDLTLSVSKRVVQFLDRFTCLNCWDINTVPVERWLVILNRWVLLPRTVAEKSQWADPLLRKQKINKFWNWGDWASWGQQWGENDHLQQSALQRCTRAIPLEPHMGNCLRNSFSLPYLGTWALLGEILLYFLLNPVRTFLCVTGHWYRSSQERKSGFAEAKTFTKSELIKPSGFTVEREATLVPGDRKSHNFFVV